MGAYMYGWVGVHVYWCPDYVCMNILCLGVGCILCYVCVYGRMGVRVYKRIDAQARGYIYFESKVDSKYYDHVIDLVCKQVDRLVV